MAERASARMRNQFARTSTCRLCGGDSRAGDAKGEAETAEAIFKKNREEKKNRQVAGENDELANSITCVGAAKPPGQRLLQHMKAAMNDENSDDCGDALLDQPERHSLFE